MRLATVVLVAGASACGFTGNGNSPGDGGGSRSDGGNGSGSGSGVIDGPPIDGPVDAAIPPTDATPARRKPITIHGNKVTGTSTNFPVWIDITDGQLGAGADLAGDDIFFTDAANAPIPYQITAWVKATGHLQAWVRAASLTAGTDTIIYVRYGDKSVATMPSPAMVFTDHFARVWHLDDALANTTIAEATGTDPGMESNAAAATGVLGGGLKFNGTNSVVNFTNPFNGGASATRSHTISAWVIAGAEAKFGPIVILGNPTNVASRWVHLNFSGGLSVGFYGGDWAPAAAAITNSTHLVHWVYDEPNKQTSLYVDGAIVGGGVHTHNFGGGNINTAGAAGTLGFGPPLFGPGGNTNPTNDGILDEVRIATVTRGAGWIATEYANQHDPGAFYMVGAEQLPP